jgi:hypothetical protein
MHLKNRGTPGLCPASLFCAPEPEMGGRGHHSRSWPPDPARKSLSQLPSILSGPIYPFWPHAPARQAQDAPGARLGCSAEAETEAEAPPGARRAPRAPIVSVAGDRARHPVGGQFPEIKGPGSGIARRWFRENEKRSGDSKSRFDS